MLRPVSTDCETRKSPSDEIVFGCTVVGSASVSCCRNAGVRVVPQRGARSIGVGMAEAMLKIEIRAKDIDD